MCILINQDAESTGIFGRFFNHFVQKSPRHKQLRLFASGKGTGCQVLCQGKSKETELQEFGGAFPTVSLLVDVFLKSSWPKRKQL